MIQIRVIEDKLCSVLACDVCGRPIEKVDEALVVMPDCFIGHRQPDNIIACQHVHKGHCYERLAAVNPYCGDLELRDHIYALLMNLHWTAKHAKEASKSSEWELRL